MNENTKEIAKSENGVSENTSDNETTTQESFIIQIDDVDTCTEVGQKSTEANQVQIKPHKKRHKQTEELQNHKNSYWIYLADYPHHNMEYDYDDRSSFVMLVFGIDFFMLVITAIGVIIALNSSGVKSFLKSVAGIAIMAGCSFLLIIINYCFCLCTCAREPPMSFIILIITNICYTFICMCLAVRYAPAIVLGAVLATVVVTFVCLLLACSGIDFTQCILVVFIASLGLAAGFLIAMLLKYAFGFDITLMRIILLCLASLLSSITLIIEFQMILGGKTVELDESDYAYGAFMVYTSIINIFLQLMALLHEILNLEDLF